MIVAGIDPGASGAIAVYDNDTSRIMTVSDMPLFHIEINKKKRKRVDAVALFQHFELLKLLGCELVLVEAVGGRPSQSASSAFTFGYGVGMVYMACIAHRLPIETVQPMVWKKSLRVPGKKDLAGRKDAERDGMIINRACELMPDAREMFYTERGGKRVDRAEAAMLAKYCGDFQIRQPNRPLLAIDTDLAYRHAETGA